MPIPAQINLALMPALLCALSMVPLALSLLWLPLINGGNDPGAILVARAATFVVALILAASGCLPSPTGPLKRLLLVVGAILAAASISTIFSRNLDSSVPLLIDYAWLGGSALLIASVASRDVFRNLTTGCLVAAVVIQTMWSFFIWWGGGDAARVQTGTFYAANQYAGYLILLVPLLVVPALTKRPRPEALAWGFLAAFVLLGILMSGSRAGAASGLAGLCLALLVTARRDTRRTLARLAVLAIGTVMVALLLKSKLLLPGSRSSLAGNIEAKGTDATTLNMRADWMLGAVRIASRSPAAGTGLGTFGDMLQQVQEPSWYWSRYTHNDYLEALADGGIFLMAGVVALPLAALWGARSALSKKMEEHSSTITALGAGLIAGSLHRLLDHDGSFAGYAVTFVAVAVLLAAHCDSSASKDSPQKRLPRVAASAIGVCCAAALVATVGLGRSRTLIGAAASQPAGKALRGARLAHMLAPYSTAPLELEAAVYEKRAHRGDLSRAAVSIQRALALNRLSSRFYLELGDLRQRLGDTKAAALAYTEAIRVAPDAPAPYGKAAEMELSMGDPRAAATTLDRGLPRIEASPDRARLAHSIASLLLLRAKAEDALAGPGEGATFILKAQAVAGSSPRS